MRSPPPSAASSTPVRIGRDSSVDAARTTCLRPSARSEAPSTTCSPSGSTRFGNSSAGIVCRRKFDRPPLMLACSPSVSTSMAPPSSERTMSTTNFAGRTATPSDPPETCTSVVIVRSRSLPVSRNWSPASDSRSPDRTGNVARVEVARCAVAKASTNTSRSQRNFTVSRFPHYWSWSGCSTRSSSSWACGLWET